MYNSYFGFREAPFSITPDPRFFYSNSVYQEAFAALVYGIKAKKGFIVITGEVGTGKTTLLRKLMRNLEATIQSIFIFNTYVCFPELLQLMLCDLGSDPKRKSRLTMIQELNGHLIQQLQKGRTVCLLIDEAQNLSDDTLEGLRLLSNLETDKEKLLQIVLMGQPELEVKLDQPKLRQFKQRVALQCRLAPLKDQEVGSYIDFRLRSVAYEGRDLFNPDAVQQIAFYSRGIPRLINIICDNALLFAYAKSQTRVSADMIKEVARDLRLGWEIQTSERPVPIAKELPTNGKEKLPQALDEEPLKGKRSLLAQVGVAGLFVLLFLVGLALVADPKQAKSYITTLGLDIQVAELLRVVGESRKFFEDWFNLREAQQIDESAPAQNQEGSTFRGSKTSAEVGQAVAGDWKNKPIVIRYGSTIFGIARDVYGASAILALDLLREFNTHIENLNLVLAGENLWLPPLGQETLLRKQSDGSLRLIVASFMGKVGAEKFAQDVRLTGYDVLITPRKVSDNLVLHRVEIVGLEEAKAANKAWDTALANDWVPFGVNGGRRDRREGWTAMPKGNAGR